MFSQFRTKTQSVSHGLVKVCNLEVQVDHHLLASRDSRPHQTHEVGIVLNAEIVPRPRQGLTNCFDLKKWAPSLAVV
jgi:hypothetical protein